MNFIPLYVQQDETLVCIHGKITQNYAYLVQYEGKENRTDRSAYVRCIKCLRETMSEDINLLEGVLGQ